MYKFVAKVEITIPGQPPQRRNEEYILGTTNTNLNGMGFTKGFMTIMFDKLESKEWIDTFLNRGIELQKKLESYQKAKYKIKCENIIEEDLECR